MACERFEDLLQEHLDRSLGKAEEAELQAHLSECSACRRDALLYDRLLSTLADCDDVDVPSAEITSGVMQALEREPAPEARVIAFPVQPRLRWGWAAMAVAAVAMMALGIQLADRPGPAPAPLVVAEAHQLVQPVVVQAKALPRKVVGRLVIDRGEASVQRAGTAGWQNKQGEIELAMNDRFKLSSQATDAILYYEDRGRLTVKPGTDLQVISNGIRVRVGTAWIKVARRGDGFHAETPNAVAAVRGTIWTVDVSGTFPAVTDVNVFKGTVEVYPGTFGQPLAKPVFVQKDQSVHVSGQVMSTAEPVQLAAYKRFGMDAPPDLLEPPVVPTAVDAVPAGTADGVVTGPTTADDTNVNGRVLLLDDDDDGGASSTSAARPRY